MFLHPLFTIKSQQKSSILVVSTYDIYDNRWRCENVQRIMEFYHKIYRQQPCSIGISSYYDHRMDSGGSCRGAYLLCLYGDRCNVRTGRSYLRRRICRADTGTVWRMSVPLPDRYVILRRPETDPKSIFPVLFKYKPVFPAVYIFFPLLPSADIKILCQSIPAEDFLGQSLVGFFKIFKCS